jgi:hypothetical protein
MKPDFTIVHLENDTYRIITNNIRPRKVNYNYFKKRKELSETILEFLRDNGSLGSYYSHHWDKKGGDKDLIIEVC